MLTKHHGLGNDFLIAVSPTVDLGPDDAVRLCDRKRGIGADGLISAARFGEDPSRWSMTLWNADGSRAAVSGNGLRCLGQALVLHHDDGQQAMTFHVQTDAGERRVAVQPDRGSDTDQVAVDMGQARPGAGISSRWAELGIDVQQQVAVDIGNPHLVAVVDDPAGVDLAMVGPAVEQDYADGINLELVAVHSRSEIGLRVWERGVGITEACGSGACAAVWASHSLGLVDNRVTVAMPGGLVMVELVDGAVLLSGPATFVAVVEVERRT
ncbi:MAG: diaminopimelate epimerase [Acidimicrobiia bacterium]|nr:diaminopimelate epimerase [Acidimicrobiia bacterium]